MVNLITNGTFEVWSSGASAAPDGWAILFTGVARESTIVKSGSYSAKLTVANSYLTQNVHTAKGIDYWKGKTVTFGCWCWSSVPSSAGLDIYDGGSTPVNGIIGYSVSPKHSGNSTWQWLTVTRVIQADATQIRLDVALNGANPAIYYDDAVAVEGNYIWDDVSEGLTSWTRTDKVTLNASFDSTIAETGQVLTLVGDAVLSSGELLLSGAGYATVPNSADWILGTDNFSVEFDATFTTLPTGTQEYYFVSQCDSNVYRWGVRYDMYGASGPHWLIRCVNGAGYQPYFPDATVSVGVKYHMKFIRLGTTFLCYRDNVLIAGTDNTNCTFTFPTCASPLYIGIRTPTTPDGFVTGKIDNLKISNVNVIPWLKVTEATTVWAAV